MGVANHRKLIVDFLIFCHLENAGLQNQNIKTVPTNQKKNSVVLLENTSNEETVYKIITRVTYPQKISLTSNGDRVKILKHILLLI